VRYVKAARRSEVTQIVLSTQHMDAELGFEEGAQGRRTLHPRSAADLKIADNCNWYINPTGKFVIGGPDGDCRPDRPQDHRRHLWRRGARMAAARSRARTRPRSTVRPPMQRAISPRTSWPRLADRCTIQLAYAIGVAQPLSVYVDLHGTGKVDESQARDGLRESWTCRRAASASIWTSTSRSMPRRPYGLRPRLSAASLDA
jgi:S-adenosylmethionine synthetase